MHLSVLAVALTALACGAADDPQVDGAVDGRGDAVDQGLPAPGDGAADVPVTLDAPVDSDGPGPLASGVCGFPGGPCCAFNRCAAAGCCVHGRCFAGAETCPVGGVCAQGSCGACGGVDQPCCFGEGCTAEATVCDFGTCRRCGGLGQPCCEGSLECTGPQTRCSSGARPGTLDCLRCGQPGTRCCPDGSCDGGCCVEEVCLPEGQSCGANNGLCAAGKCASCGGPGQPCCPSGLCQVGNTCDEDDTCRVCGAPGQSCCFDPDASPCRHGAICNLGRQCEACGSAGQPCCPLGLCGQGACCTGGRCFGPGEVCQQTLTPLGGPTVTTLYGVCKGGHCDGCGRPGLPCCPIENGIFGRRQGNCDQGSTCTQDPDSGDRSCKSCGGPGQDCCEDERCSSGCCARITPILTTCASAGSACEGTPTAPGRCDAVTGSCASCGGIGQPCCAGTTCITAAFCDGGTCLGCGQLGQPCCQVNGCNADLICRGRCVYGAPP